MTCLNKADIRYYRLNRLECKSFLLFKITISIVIVALLSAFHNAMYAGFVATPVVFVMDLSALIYLVVTTRKPYVTSTERHLRIVRAWKEKARLSLGIIPTTNDQIPDAVRNKAKKVLLKFARRADVSLSLDRESYQKDFRDYLEIWMLLVVDTRVLGHFEEIGLTEWRKLMA